MSASTDVFLARQPILDRYRKVLAYELLFRGEAAGEAHVSDDARATAQVIAQAFSRHGLNSVVGTCTGFVNIDAEMLMSRRIERLPRQRVVLELLETVVVDDKVLERCAALRREGYRLALDDFCAIDGAHEPLLELVDIVKIDVLQLDDQALEQLVRRLRRYRPRLLAEKVDTLARARHCFALGFDLFQGYFFCRPAALSA